MGLRVNRLVDFSAVCLLMMVGATSAVGDAVSALEVYPAPTGISPSAQYSVQLIQGEIFTTNSSSLTDTWKNVALSRHGTAPPASSFVYQIQNPGYLANGQPSGVASSSTEEQATSWTSFSFSGSVTVKVTNSKPFASARVLPSSAGITPRVDGNTVVFTLRKPGQFAIDFCSTGSSCSEENDTDLTNPMLVFANPMEADAPRPSETDVLRVAPGLSVPTGEAMPQLKAFQSTLFFGPGVYDLGPTPVTVAANQTVYIAGGAYVKGFFAVAPGAARWSIRGAGILSGESLLKAQCVDTKSGCPPMISGPNERRGVVEGITLINSPLYNIALGGYNKTFKSGLDNTGIENTVNNVKIISWAGNGDGIAAAYGSADPGSEVRNSFLKVGDSGLHLNSSHLRILNCTFWQLNNAAPIEISDTMGTNLNIDVTDVAVSDSNVIRTEHAKFDSMEKAIFSAHHGGKGHLSHYTFRNIHIENSNFRLFSLAVRPSPWSEKNTVLGSLADLSFEEVHVTDEQTRPDLFQSYDRQHELSGVRFRSVTVAKTDRPTPTITFNANRVMSLAGNATYDPLWRNTQSPSSFQLWRIDPATAPPPAPQYSSFSLMEPALGPTYQVQAIGDFFGSSYASVLLLDTASHQLGVWRDPAVTGATGSGPIARVYTLETTDGNVAGVGDFNGDGYTDVVLWNIDTQSGKVLLMNGARITGQIAFQPAKMSDWSLVGIGDFNQSGASQVLLRDTTGSLEILALSQDTEEIVSYDFASSALFNATTEYFNATWASPSHGDFDANWTVAAVGDFQGLGYADILWLNPQSNDLGLTAFSFDLQTVAQGPIFDRLESQSKIIAVGDFDANGTSDILLESSNPGGSQISITYVSQWLGNLFQPGPVIDAAIPFNWPWTLD